MEKQADEYPGLMAIKALQLLADKYQVKVECPLCTHRWIAVYPVVAEELECPNCNNLSEPIIIKN